MVAMVCVQDHGAAAALGSQIVSEMDHGGMMPLVADGIGIASVIAMMTGDLVTSTEEVGVIVDHQHEGLFASVTVASPSRRCS